MGKNEIKNSSKAVPKNMVRSYSKKKLWLLHIIRKLWFGLKGVKFEATREVKELSRPSIVLCSHGSFIDFFYAGEILRKEGPNFIAARLYFYKDFNAKFMQGVGCFPKSMFTTDLESAMNCMRVLKRQGVLTMMPEARLSTVGEFEDIQPSTFKFLKGAKADVYYINIKGGYLAMPKWGKGLRRGARIEAKLDLLFTKEEAASLTVEEIQERTEKALYFNDFEWLETKPKIKYRSRRLAEGLENILNLCPHCHSKHSLSTKGHTVKCDSCGMSTKMDKRYAFDSGVPFANFQEWYNWQTEEMRKEVQENPDFKLESKVVLNHASKDGKTSLYKAGKGLCVLNREGLTYKGTRDGEETEVHFPQEQIYRLLFGAGVDFEIYEDREIFYFEPENLKTCVDWYMASKLLKE